MLSCLHISRQVSKTLKICRSTEWIFYLSFRSSCVPCLFSTASKHGTNRHIPQNIPLPTYITSGRTETPNVAEIKTEEQIMQMLPACKLAADILQDVRKNIKIGITTDDLDEIVYRGCMKAGAYPSPLMYKGFPKSVCTSVNEVACHGIPGLRVLNSGDIVNVDVTVFYKGYHGDTSATFSVGEINQRSMDLMVATQNCLNAGISVCHDGARFSDIGEIIFETACAAGFEVIPFFCGHGIGSYFHGPPDIVHVPSAHCGEERMKAGMTFTIEPILCAGQPEIKILDDGWTVVTSDGSWSAQYEHTILITAHGAQILTV